MSNLLHKMDHAPMTNLHRRLALAAGLGIFLDGYDLVIVGVALIQLKAQWHLLPEQIGALGSAALAGAFIGALLGGRIADHLGRKAIYIIDLVAFLVSALLCGMAWGITSLVIFRFLLGIGVGADYPLSATYLAEFMPVKKRGGVITWTFGLWSVGAIVANLVGYVCLLDHANGWRWMFILGAVPAAIVIYLRGNLPESPRWYLRKNKPEKAAAVIARIDPTIPPEEIDILLEEHRKQVHKKPAPMKHLFIPPFLRATLLVCLPWFIMDVVGYYLTVYLPLILGQLGFGAPRPRVLGGAFVYASFVLGYIPLALVIDKIGRIWPQIIGFIGMGISFILVGMASAHVQTVQKLIDGHMEPVMVASGTTLAIIFIAILLQQITNSFGPSSTTYILPSEVYPTDLRASGHGFATAFSRTGAVISLFFLPMTEQWMGQLHFFIMLGGISMLGAFFTWAFRVDTTGQALLQDLPITSDDPTPIPVLETA